MSVPDEGVGSSEVRAARDGRVTIPARLRQAARIEPGSRLVLCVDRGRIVIEERAHLLSRIQQEAIAAAAAHSVTDNAVDQLLAERRAEVAREAVDRPTGSTGPSQDAVPTSGGVRDRAG